MPGAGVPVNMTLVSEKMNSAGYQSHFVGMGWMPRLCLLLAHHSVRVSAEQLVFFQASGTWGWRMRA